MKRLSDAGLRVLTALWRPFWGPWVKLGDVVYVELPETGSTFNKDDEFGTVESVKAVSELYMPVGGQVVEVNTELEDAPEKVNSEPYRDGWMLLVKPSDPTEVADLLERDAYLQLLKG